MISTPSKKLQPICDVLMTITVKDSETGLVLEGASVDIKDAEGTVFGTKVSNAQGVVEYIIECDVNTLITGTKADYESGMASRRRN